MRYPTEYRIIVDIPKHIKELEDINNKGNFVVNIKNLTKNKEVKTMLENEKVSKLEQLNSLKGEYENRLEEIKAEDINSLIESKVAEVREQISNDVVANHNELIAKTEMKIEVINEMIADVEAIPVETPVDEVPADDTETNI